MAPKTPAGIALAKMDRDAFKEALAIYDPDNDPEFQIKTITTDELYERAKIHKNFKDGEKACETNISGTLALQRADGSGVRAAGFKDWAELQKLQCSSGYRGQKLRETHGITHRGKKLKEAFPDTYSGEPGDQGTVAPDNEFHPLTLGPFNRQLYIHDFLDQASKAYEGFHHNPILKAGVNTITNFVMGDGIKVVAANPMCQAIWDKYLDRVARTGIPYPEKMRMMFRDASIIGETFVTDPMMDGGPTMKVWDASTVWEILTNPRDIEEVYYAYRQFPTQWQIPYTATGKTPPQLSEYVIEQIPGDKWLQVKFNATVGEKRGRSDLFSVLGWGKRFKDWFDAAVINGQISNAFVLWWKVNGTQADVDTLRNNPDFAKVPPPGSAWFTNEQVTPSLLRPEGGVREGDKTGEQLLSIIAVSLNLPPEYFGVAGAATRADALVRGEPAQRFFAQRQEMVRDVARWQFRRVMLRAQIMGELPLKQPKQAGLRDIVAAMRSGDWKAAAELTKRVQGKSEYEEKMDITCEVILPNLITEDRTLKLRDLGAAHATRVISKETYARQVAEELKIKNFDFDEEQAKINDEEARGIIVSPMMSTPSGGQQGKFGSPDSNAAYRQNNRGRGNPEG